MRTKVAKEWSELNGVEIIPEMINCVGCRIEGVKTPFCDALCPIRQCALGKEVETCGNCSEMNACKKLFQLLRQKGADVQNHLFEGHHSGDYIRFNMETYLRFYSPHVYSSFPGR